VVSGEKRKTNIQQGILNNEMKTAVFVLWNIAYNFCYDSFVSGGYFANSTGGGALVFLVTVDHVGYFSQVYFVDFVVCVQFFAVGVEYCDNFPLGIADGDYDF